MSKKPKTEYLCDFEDDPVPGERCLRVAVYKMEKWHLCKFHCSFLVITDYYKTLPRIVKLEGKPVG